MQFFFRTSRNTGVGVGPLGLLLVAPFYLMAVMLVFAVYAVVFVAAVVVVVVRALAGRRKLHAADG